MKVDPSLCRTVRPANAICLMSLHRALIAAGRYLTMQSPTTDPMHIWLVAVALHESAGSMERQARMCSSTGLASSGVRMPTRVTAMPLGRTASLIARVPMSTPCDAAFWRASMAASSTGLGAGCQSRAPCMELSLNAENVAAPLCCSCSIVADALMSMKLQSVAIAKPASCMLPCLGHDTHGAPSDGRHGSPAS